MTAAIALRVGVSVTDVADACHDAVDRFLRLAPTKLELATWLRGAYRRATSFVPQPLRSLSAREQSLSDGDIADVVHHAQCAVRQAIAAALYPGADGIARSLPDALHLSVVTDAFGGSGFAAVDVPSACLADRVLALIVAEYLTRPEEFVESSSASSGKFEVFNVEARGEQARGAREARERDAARSEKPRPGPRQRA